MARREPRSARTAPQYKTVDAVIAEAITSGRDLKGVIEELRDKLVIVVRTDNPANKING
ncbi:hypothetical protein SEA_WOLLYPOG_83 [Arthrobacter phage Wollypog]|uniref:Uncharacterized protein n=1 Tax=Arthrobacter phage Wollypog TaxID=2790985 RepID=A0A7T3KCB5_9CAUD|nr:hypothetical protein PP291_gp83 [Arthrobacter phage Wollypog]QPX62632.1 hypothetical protein SEA_WOLLYPOG_83 [Arthrobacter phage Wollypog]